MFANIFYDYNANKIHLWEYQNNILTHSIENYTPYCFLYDENGEYVDLKGKRCRKKSFKSWFEQREFVRNSVNTLEGDLKPEDRFLIDKYYKIKEFEKFPDLNTHIIDIECKADKGFPSADNIENELLSISIYSSLLKKYYVFGVKDYTPKNEFVEYIYCEDEKDLLRKYFKWHRENYPDVITGWNIVGFDIPYILNRAKYIIGESFIKKYSPIGILQEWDKKWNIAGISILDYIELYKTFSQNVRESYSLNYISSFELKKEKTKFDGTLKDLWKSDWSTFIDYNINDVVLVVELEEKLGYLKLVQAQSYSCRIPFEKFNSSIKKFDNYLISILKERKIVVPTTSHHTQENTIPGGYVSEPKIGYYKNVVSYDFTSLYPHIIMGLNISPETYLGKISEGTELDLENFKDVSISEEKKIKIKERIIKDNLIFAPNGVLFHPKEGFIPFIIKDLYAKRKYYKDKMMVAKKKFEQTKEIQYKKEASVYDSFQYNFKILLNSAYGILANPNYRFFNQDAASSITLMGQKLIKYASEILNLSLKEKFKLNNDITLYSDTDSVYLDFSEILQVMKINDEKKFINLVNTVNDKVIQPFLEQKFLEFSKKHNIKLNYFNLKREVIAIGAVFIQKKKYALYVIDEEGFTLSAPKMKVKGMEIVRSSTPGFCREKIKEVMKEIFINFNKDKLVSKIKKIKEEFKNAPIEDISFPRGISGMLKYVKNGQITSGTPIQIRASHNYNQVLEKFNLSNKYEKIYDGDKIKFIYLKENNPIHENILAFKENFPIESGLGKYIDVDLQFEKSFLAPLEGITDAIQWKIDLDNSSLEEFF